MKINRYGQAKVLTQPELELLFNDGLQTQRDRTLFGVCLYTACRINEACTLLTNDIFNAQGVVRSHLVIRRGNTKGQLDTRTTPVLEDLRLLLVASKPDAGKTYLFPGQWGRGHLHPDSAARILRTACARAGIEGVSTHSFRRTALTQMSNAGIPLRVIQKISGHRSLTQLQAYLEVQPEQVTGAIASLAMLAVSQRVVKGNYSGVSATIVILSLMMSGLQLATYQSLHERIRVSGISMISAYTSAVNTVYRYNLNPLNVLWRDTSAVNALH